MIKNDNIKDNIIEKSPTGVLVINKLGIIEYANISIKEILGTNKLIGINIFDYETVKGSQIYPAILSGFNGQSSKIKYEKYKSFLHRKDKILNCSIIPNLNNNKIENITLLLHDVSNEFLLTQQAEKNHRDTIEFLSFLVNKKDEYTWKHSKNVSEYTTMICDKLDIPKVEKERIILSANLHDIGKIGISDFILNKESRLTDEEYETMKTHSIIGSDIIGKITGMEDVRKIIKHHHERWDGNGYPSKLRNNMIPLGSQIIAIADTYDAVTENRVYRKALGKDRALEILKEEKGRQFNAKLVDVFLSVIA